MSVEWWSAGQRWLEQQALKEAAVQKRAWVKAGRSAKTFRYNPPEWHRDAVEALGRNDEETFKAIKLGQIGMPPLTAAKGRRHATKKKTPAQLDREIAEVLAGGGGERPINKRKGVRHFSEWKDKIGRTHIWVTYEDRSGHPITPEELKSYRGREAAGLTRHPSSHATRRGTSVEVDTSVYRRTHGAEPRGFGNWKFVIGAREYAYGDESDLFRPAVSRGAHKAGRVGLPFAKAKEYAIAEAKRRGAAVVGVAP